MQVEFLMWRKSFITKLLYFMDYFHSWALQSFSEAWLIIWCYMNLILFLPSFEPWTNWNLAHCSDNCSLIMTENLLSYTITIPIVSITFENANFCYNLLSLLLNPKCYYIQNQTVLLFILFDWRFLFKNRNW